MHKLLAEMNLFSWNGINEEVVGDITTFTYSSTHFIVLGVMGVVLTLVGAVLLWVTKFSFRDKGYWSYFMVAMGLFFLSAPLVLGHQSVVLTPTQVEIDTYGAPQVIPIASMKSIETREDRSGPKRRVTVRYYFHLTDGTSKDFTGGLVGAVVKKLEVLNNEGRLNVAHAQPPATTAAAPAPSSAPPAATAPSTPTAPAPQPTTGSSRFARSRPIDKRPTASRPVIPSATNKAAAPAVPAVTPSILAGRPSSKSEPSATAINVTSDMELAVGAPVEAKWGALYYQAEVLELLPNDKVRIHYTGWSSATDETVDRAKLWVEPSKVAEQAASGESAPDETEPPQAVTPQLPADSNRTARSRAAASKSSGPARPKREPSATAINVASTTAIGVGTPVEAQWGSMYYPAEVVELLPGDQVRVHYAGWSSAADETLHRTKLWFEPAAIAEKTTSGESDSAETDTPASDEPLASDPPKIRTWTDATGKHKVEAKFLDFADGKVRLKRQDGKIVTMALERLSKADQKLVRGLGAAK